MFVIYCAFFITCIILRGLEYILDDPTPFHALEAWPCDNRLNLMTHSSTLK